MQIGILQCGHFPTAEGFRDRTYSELYATMLAGRGLTFRTWSVVDMEFPGSVQDTEGWLITGSRHGAYEDLPFIARLEHFIRDAFGARVPLVGVCFGHQIIAQAMGGTVEKYTGGWSIGRTEYDFDGTVLAANAWHQDQVVAVPEGADVIASSPSCANAGLLFRGHAFTVQPHPEFEREEVDLLLKRRASGLVPGALIQQATDALDAPVDNAEIADRIAAFFKENRHV